MHCAPFSCLLLMRATCTTPKAVLPPFTTPTWCRRARPMMPEAGSLCPSPDLLAIRGKGVDRPSSSRPA